MVQAPSERIDRKILISVDGSLAAIHAVEYAASMVRLIPTLHFVLTYIMPAIPPYLEKETMNDGETMAKVKRMKQANRVQGEKVLKEATERLVKNGVEGKRVETRLLPRVSGLVQVILNEAETGLYDALAIGRRGLSRTQELFMGSVSQQLVQHAANTPLWIIDGEVANHKVMVAVDGSEASLRAVDHVAFMLGENPEASVHFVHVSPTIQSYCAIDLEKPGGELGSSAHSLSGEDLEEIQREFDRTNGACLDDFTGQATRILLDAGFSPSRISTETRSTTMGVSKAIIRAAMEDDYGTIVLGRRGMGSSFFLGSTSERVIRGVRGKAVWLIN